MKAGTVCSQLVEDGVGTAEKGRVIWWREYHGVGRYPPVTVNANVKARRYIDDMLRPTVIPFLQHLST